MARGGRHTCSLAVVAINYILEGNICRVADERQDKLFEISKVLKLAVRNGRCLTLENQCYRNGAIPFVVDVWYPGIGILIGEKDHLGFQLLRPQKRKEFLFQLAFEIEAYKQHLYVLVRVLFSQFFEAGQFFHAGFAPGCPEVEHQGRVAGLLYAGDELRNAIVDSELLRLRLGEGQQT